MRVQIRRLRAEVLQQLRTGHSRITLTTGDRDDIVHQADHLLHKADQALTRAAQVEGTDTTDGYTAVLAEVDQAINQAVEMVEEAKVEAAAGPESEDGRLDVAEPAIGYAGEMVEKAKVKKVIRQRGRIH